MPMIYVKAKPGRIVRESPKGNFIPSDTFVPVEGTPYVKRLIDFHGDLVVKRDHETTQLKPKAKPTPEPVVEPPAPKEVSNSETKSN